MAYDTTDAEVHRVRSEVRRFKEHVLVFVAVMAVLVLANIIAGGIWYAHFWLFWIALVWGVLIALQAIRLFGHDFGRDWEDRMVNHVMAARRNEPRPPPPRQPGSPRPQPAPPPRPPTPAWPPSSAQTPAPIVTPAPPHSTVVVADAVPPAPQPESLSGQEPLITPPPDPPKDPAT